MPAKNRPNSLREMFGTLTIVVGATACTTIIILLTLATAIILTAWRAHDTFVVWTTTLQLAVPVIWVSLFGSIATLGAYGWSRNAARGSSEGQTAR